MKKVLRVARRVLVALLMVFTFIVMIFTILSFTSFNNQKGVFGFQFFVVLSDSMKGTFNAGDVVVSQTVDPATLQPGDVITFESIDPANFGLVVTHQIYERTTYEGEPAFVTIGVANGVVDAVPAPESSVLGQYRFRIPSAGYLFDYLRSTAGYLILVLLPFVLLIAYLTVRFLRHWKAYRVEKQEEFNAELDGEKERYMKAQEELELLKSKLQRLERGEDLPSESSYIDFETKMPIPGDPVLETNVKLEAEPERTEKAESMLVFEGESEIERKPEPKPKSDSESGPKAMFLRSKRTPKPDPDPEPASEPVSVPESKPKSKAKAEPKAKLEPIPEPVRSTHDWAGDAGDLHSSLPDLESLLACPTAQEEERRHQQAEKP